MVALTPTALGARLRHVRVGVVALALAAPLVLLLARLLPTEGVGLAARLAAAALCVLLLPGALVLRAFAWPREPALAVTASFALSLALAFGAFAVTFAVAGTLWLTIALLGGIAAAAVLPAATAYVPRSTTSVSVAFAAVTTAALAFGAVIWWATDVLGTGDVLFHLARARKLAEADALTSVAVANEYRDGGLHPGYAFPLWHGVLALVARLGGVDVALVSLHLNSMLTPFAFAAAYAAGTALFRSPIGGAAVLAAQVAHLGFSRGGVGSFGSFASPGSITRVVLAPALVALVFAFVREGRRRMLVPVAAAALGLAVIHPTYVIFVGIALAGFALVWLVVSHEARANLPRLALAALAIGAPTLLFFLWLLPVVTSTASHAPSAAEEMRALNHYGEQLQRVGDAYRVAPHAITRAGPVVVAALAALPLIALWGRRIWSAFAVGGTLLILAMLLVPDLFTRFSDLVSISQSRRLAQFIPVPFAIAAAAVVLGRLRLAGVGLAVAAGVGVELLYTTETGHIVETGGPVWPLWVALVGAPLALVAGFALRRRRFVGDPAVGGWAAAAALAFTAPIAVAGLAGLEPERQRDPAALSPGLVAELRELPPETVVFAPVPTAYRAAAFAPVYVAATPPPHAADTEENRPYRRQRDVIRFFAPDSGLSDRERRELLDGYGADVLVVDKHRPFPRELVRSFALEYEDARYALYRVAAG